MRIFDLVTIDADRLAELLSMSELCELCELTHEHLHAYVEYGVLEPTRRDHDDWWFSGIAVQRVRRARRLQREFELDVHGVALVMDLIDELHELRREVSELRARLARWELGG